MKIAWLVLLSCCLLVASFGDAPQARAAVASATPTPCPTSTSPLSTAVPC
ncbi:MAG TPA: hypothetical protein VMU38_07925 [Candidatus Binatia bacterium]|nr:hypothetical protein [Candidatus Binatia bacterium]